MDYFREYSIKFNLRNKQLVSRIKCTKNKPINWFLLKLLERNNPPWIIVPEVGVFDRELEIIYDTFELQSLVSYLRQLEFQVDVTREEIKKRLAEILVDLNWAIEESKLYYLTDKNFFTNENFIFIHKESNKGVLLFDPFDGYLEGHILINLKEDIKALSNDKKKELNISNEDVKEIKNASYAVSKIGGFQIMSANVTKMNSGNLDFKMRTEIHGCTMKCLIQRLVQNKELSGGRVMSALEELLEKRSMGFIPNENRNKRNEGVILQKLHDKKGGVRVHSGGMSSKVVAPNFLGAFYQWFLGMKNQSCKGKVS